MSKHWLGPIGISGWIVFIVGLSGLPEGAQASLINLATFARDPVQGVSFDGLNATMTELQDYSSILLYNDPSIGGTGIAIPVGDYRLVFDYTFVEPAGNDDELNAYLFDPATFQHLTDTYISQPGQGTIVWNLAGVGFQGQTVGLEFDLNSFDLLAQSHITLSDVRIEEIPEPATMSLALIAALLLRHDRLRYR
jgi:hypothetical protein